LTDTKAGQEKTKTKGGNPMVEKSNTKERFIVEKKRALTDTKHLRGEIVGNRTIIHLEALSREYQLGQAYQNVRNLEFRSKGKLKLETFADYLKTRKDILKLPFSIESKPRPAFPDDEKYRNARSSLHYPNGDLPVLVDKALYNAVSGSINQYVLDIARDGYFGTIHVVQGGSPVDIRTYINKLRPKPRGVLLVGSISVPWYEIGTDQFPCDLYYMDINGTWNDPDGNGKFNAHSGDLNPEIWVGRLYTPTNNGNDAALINDYFLRNHKFRSGLLGHFHSALAYVDDDWTGFNNCAFDQMFSASDITTYTNPGLTDADLYKAEVNSARSWVQLCAHSWPQGHAFTVGASKEYIETPYFRDLNPPNAHFYNLFCCGPGKFTTSDYLAGWYIFDKTGGGTNLGLTAIASAKSGSMLFFEDFYKPLGQGKVIGDAFVDWWKARGPDHEEWEKEWFYGLVLLGDPTLSWWKGVVPQLKQPQSEDVFDHWPRKMQFVWDPVTLPAVTYSVEIDAYGAVNAGKWAEETKQTFLTYHNVKANTLEHTFVGAQRGRWRVAAKIGTTLCSWSPWSYFKFTV
jgi:hypothetical protein